MGLQNEPVLLALALLLILSPIICKDNGKKPHKSDSDFRIVNGTLVDIRKVPFLVAIHILGNMCGGALISNEHIITAAHCVYNTPPNYVKVAIGQTEVRSYETIHLPIEKIQLHPQYEKPVNDVAILTLPRPMRLCNGEKPLVIKRTQPKMGDKGLIAGWGTIKDKGPFGTLFKTEVTVIDRKICEENYKNFTPIVPTMFCAAGQFTDACQGDSGGPMIINNELAGVISWAIGCNEPDHPGVYTNLPIMKKFIQEATNNKAKFAPHTY